MKNISCILPVTFLAGVLLLPACENNARDEEKPIIDISGETAFPKNCDTLYAGQSFTFHARFRDNVELGSFGLAIHNNFDHHSHSTEVEACQLSPVKQPVNPFLYIKEFDIQSGKKEYEASVQIAVPAGVDDGDYHFFISLTDKTGWRAEKGLSIKIANMPAR